MDYGHNISEIFKFVAQIFMLPFIAEVADNHSTIDSVSVLQRVDVTSTLLKQQKSYRGLTRINSNA